MQSDSGPRIECLRFKFSHGVGHIFFLGPIQFFQCSCWIQFPLCLPSEGSFALLCQHGSIFGGCLELCPGNSCKVKFGLGGREASDLLLASAIVTVPSTAFTIAPTCNKRMLNDSRMMLGSDEHHLVTPEASELESSVLPPPLHISRYIYRHCHGVLDLHPDLGINLFKRIL